MADLQWTVTVLLPVLRCTFCTWLTRSSSWVDPNGHFFSSQLVNWNCVTVFVSDPCTRHTFDRLQYFTSKRGLPNLWQLHASNAIFQTRKFIVHSYSNRPMYHTAWRWPVLTAQFLLKITLYNDNRCKIMKITLLIQFPLLLIGLAWQ